MEKIYTISAYEDKLLGVTCPKFEFKRSDYESEFKKLDPSIKESYVPKLDRATQYLKNLELSTKEIDSVSSDLIELCDVLPFKQSKNLLIICFNLLSRAALNGNINAMNSLVTVNFTPTNDDVTKILVVDGIEDLDFRKVKKTLHHKLGKNKNNENAFTEAIKEIKQKSKLSRRELLKSSPIAKFLPNSVTIISMCCGLTSIRFAINKEWEYAVFSIMASGFFDMFDGKIARFLSQSSALGVELDSLSDLMCFGVAPSIVLYLAAMYQYGMIGWEICLFYTVCCALRLARFNATHSNPDEVPELELKYFVGIPAPAGAILALFPLILSFGTHNNVFSEPLYVTLFLLSSGCLMVCQIHSFSSKIIKINNSNMWIVGILITIVVICLFIRYWVFLAIFFTLYMLSIPFAMHTYSKALKTSKLKE